MADLKKWLPFRFRRHEAPANERLDRPFAMPMNIGTMHEEMDRMFGRLWSDPFAAFETKSRWFGDFSKREFLPKLDVSDDKNFMRIELEVPGIKRDDINVEVEDGVLTVSGEKKLEEHAEDKGWYRTERSYGMFKRSIPLPAELDTDKVEARFDKGVLMILVPKTEKAKTPGKKVMINA